MIKISISVHTLVDYVLRSGDIDDRIFNIDTMKEGTAIHREYQNLQGENYLSEYYIKHDFIYNNYFINLKGFIDGISISNDGDVTIEEIKSARVNSLKDYFEQNKDWHLGQAEVYGYMYCLENGLDSINISLIYISQEKRNTLIKHYKYTKNELEVKFFSYLKVYCDYLDMTNRFKEVRDFSLVDLSFPFATYRKGQTEIIDLVKENIGQNKTLFIEASTGIGKTISLLYGVLKSVVDNKVDKIFYLTAKNSGFDAVIEALNLLYDREYMRLKAVQITAKEKICMNKSENRNCNPDDCPFTKDYYSKINDVIRDSYLKYDLFTKETILEIAKENDICPFELSLDLTDYSDLIICDYNYVFDPVSKIIRYFDEEGNYFSQSKVLLVDEAHNLINRSRNSYSCSVSLKELNEAKQELKSKRKSLLNLLNKIEKQILKYDGKTKEKDLRINEIDFDLINFIDQFNKAFLTYKRKYPFEKMKLLDNFSKNCNRFIKIYEYFDFKNFRLNFKREEDDKKIIMTCLDPSKYLNETNSLFLSTIYFSGTLSPNDYYQKMILGTSKHNFQHIDSPFLDDQLRVLVDSSTSILYKDRESTLPFVTKEIISFTNQKVGNYLIFCPSFEYLTKLKTLLEKANLPNLNLMFQNKNMTISEREEFIDNFELNPKKTTIGVTVLGGIFSEGIDLVEDRLIGVVVIGVGYPSVSFENNQLSEYFEEETDFNAFDFTYVYPGINKIMQAVGRIVRSDNDKGMALLIDKRFKNANYKFIFDTFWKNHSFIKNNDEIVKEIQKFYK